ncbi:MAG TPA: hypothetical protein VID04_18375 [Methylomirabilota bacterium]|jgi:hypothetical protein
MAAYLTSRALLICSLVLFTIGIERLANAYLMRGPMAEHPIPFFIGLLCTGAGAILSLAFWARR